VIVVTPTGTGDGSTWANAANLQDALTAGGMVDATAGDEIWVAAGTYYPDDGLTSPPVDIREATFQLVDDIAIYGGFAGTETQRSDRDPDPATNTTTLSGDIDQNDTPDFGNREGNSYNVVIGSGTTTNTVLDGFTISGGNADDVGTSCPNNCGGGIYNDAGSPTLTNLTISGNQASFGGGMYNDGSSPALTNVTFTNNQADTAGGGMHNRDSSNPTLTNVIFTDHESGVHGGGMHNRDSSNPTLTNVTFTNNQAGDTGGGITSSRDSNASLINVTIQSNEARVGGGIFNFESDPTLTNVLVSGNLARAHGGGVYNHTSDPTLTNVTISGNRAGNGGGVFHFSGGRSTIQNSIIWGNTPNQVVGGSDYSYSLVEGENLSASNDNLNGTAGNATPDFVNPIAATSAPTTTGDYRLQAGSDAIDRGDDSLNNEPTDLDGNQRKVDDPATANFMGTSIIDLGAIEFSLSQYDNLGGGVLVRKRADTPVVEAGVSARYTIQLTNLTTRTLTVQTITDTLPLSVTYLAGSTMGSLSSNPTTSTLDTNQQQLVWQSPLTIDATESLTLSFGVRISPTLTSGIIVYNQATAYAEQDGAPINVIPTGLVAGVRIAVPVVATDTDIDTGSGSIWRDPRTGELVVSQRRGQRSAVTITSTLECAGGGDILSATLRLNDQVYPMQPVAPGSDRYSATIPAEDIERGTLAITVYCAGIDPVENTVGRIVLYDPSGIISDAESGEPIVGATVTLYQAPGEEPGSASCPTVDTRPAPTNPDEPWSGVADWQPQPGDIQTDPSLEPAIIDPTVNPQITNDEGRYGWDVIAGCWYIIVEADGYEERVSPLVGVPPEVTDLDLTLEPLTNLQNEDRLYLPIVVR
jgi:uncharacterized repeat protein (TIGR01451 family)